MAVRYAVATGNWSNAATWNGGTLPTAADDVYSNNQTVTIDIDITVISLQNTATTGVTSGGSFQVTSSRTITCTKVVEGIINVANVVCLNVNTAGNVIINSDVRGRDGSSVRCITKSGTGALTINGSLRGLFSTGANGGALEITNTGTVTVVGNILDPSNSGQTVLVSSTSTLNVIGLITSGPYNSQQTIRVNAANCIINVTGNIIVGGGGSTGWSVAAIGSGQGGTQINLVGDIDGTSGNSNLKVGINLSGANYIVQHTGNIIGTSDNVSGGIPFSSSAVGYYNHIGYIKASMNSAGFISTNVSSINLLTGPFICTVYGVFPFSVFRMNYIPTIGSYIEFRDNSTNGALSPGPIAPPASLVAPSTIVDSPIPADVRQGVTYALGSLTGTLAVPAPGSVALGVPTDNTVGTAVLTPAAVWDYATASITDPNSIGARLKNASTVDTTGSQLAALL